ncbi:hypothetical protein HY641_02010 [Candidatus Woesearchaeota archaeon]|nr:hypothetical protein [Candidatus Woesearchaeota archaeon]
MTFLDDKKEVKQMDFKTMTLMDEYVKIWDEVQRQLNVKGYLVTKGVIQDVTFIDVNVGRKRYYKEKKAKKEGKTIEYTPKQLAHIDKDGTFAVKGNLTGTQDLCDDGARGRRTTANHHLLLYIL